jgi:2-methylisocitrate lyase-like PEP mutase family enzyme
VWDHLEIVEVIERLLSYEASGANILFALGFEELRHIEQLVSTVNSPVKVMRSSPTCRFGLAELGVKRVSVGSAFAQIAYGNLLSVVEEINTNDTFQFTEDDLDYLKLGSSFQQEPTWKLFSVTRHRTPWEADKSDGP